MFEGTRGTSTYRGNGFTTRSIVSRETDQDIGHCHPTNEKDNSKILLGTMEKSYKGRGHMGKRG
jgi:hypothetical protein